LLPENFATEGEGMKRIAWFVFCWLASSTVTHAASFDCGKASTKIETLICGNEELSKLDESLKKAYQKSLERNDVRQQAIKSQRQWLKDVRNQCQSAECVENAYVTRIKEVEMMSSFGIVIMSAPDNKSVAPVSPTKVPEVKQSKASVNVTKKETEQTWEWVEEDTRTDEVLRAVAHEEFLIGTWEGIDHASSSIYGTMEIENDSISWFGCKSQYSIVLNTVGVTYPDEHKLGVSQDERYVTLKLKLGSGTCDEHLGYLQFSIAPNNPEIAKVIEYGKNDKPEGWITFGKR
jgi:uncharacterized protein